MGSKAIYHTTRNAPNYRLVAIDLENPAEENWTTLIEVQSKFCFLLSVLKSPELYHHHFRNIRTILYCKQSIWVMIKSSPFICMMLRYKRCHNFNYYSINEHNFKFIAQFSEHCAIAFTQNWTSDSSNTLGNGSNKWYKLR